MYSFSAFQQKLKAVEDWLKGEFSGIRSGQATPAILDGVRVESYGSMMPMNQVASISIEDTKTLRVSPWDKGNIKAIEKAISEADLGLSTSSDGEGVRVHFPDLTAERRTQLNKLVGQKLEEARVRTRHERDEVWNDIQKQEKAGELSEDDRFRAKEEMEKITKEMNAVLEELAQRKEEELAA